jgi:chemotaxis signal transduction protein
MTSCAANSFVVFPIGRKHFALPATLVSELAQPDTPQVFPHTTPLLIGVLVRRGRIVPVCDVAQVLVRPDEPPRKFYLIATKKSAQAPELIAVPVTGECELVTGDMLPPTSAMPDYVIGTIALQDQKVEVVDLERIMTTGGEQAATMKHSTEVPA